MRQAASHDWRNVDPSIFGTLLEQALDPAERKRLGAHYTPRAYVERLVSATVIEPLRAEWGASRRHRRAPEGGRPRCTTRWPSVRRFHDKLCATRVLDPACGTGNFLYVALEMMKRLEGEVLEALAALGGQEALTGPRTHEVDPHQFFGLEINPRAAAIAELVLWIGHLQWHFRTKGGVPSEPILRAFKNIVVMRRRARRRQGFAARRERAAGDAAGRGRRPVEVYDYRNPRRPEWPEAEFVVGNPPFIGGKDIRARQGDEYAEALWAAHPDMNESADFVMYWWDRAADILARKGTALRRFGLVTTNSISQVFQRRVIERWLSAKSRRLYRHGDPRPSVDESHQGRGGGSHCDDGLRSRYEGWRPARRSFARPALETDEPVVDFAERAGRINADLTVGVDVTRTTPAARQRRYCARPA